MKLILLKAWDLLAWVEARVLQWLQEPSSQHNRLDTSTTPTNIAQVASTMTQLCEPSETGHLKEALIVPEHTVVT